MQLFSLMKGIQAEKTLFQTGNGAQAVKVLHILRNRFDHNQWAEFGLVSNGPEFAIFVRSKLPGEKLNQIPQEIFDREVERAETFIQGMEVGLKGDKS